MTEGARGHGVRKSRDVREGARIASARGTSARASAPPEAHSAIFAHRAPERPQSNLYLKTFMFCKYKGFQEEENAENEHFLWAFCCFPMDILAHFRFPIRFSESKVGCHPPKCVHLFPNHRVLGSGLNFLKVSSSEWRFRKFSHYNP